MHAAFVVAVNAQSWQSFSDVPDSLCHFATLHLAPDEESAVAAACFAAAVATAACFAAALAAVDDDDAVAAEAWQVGKEALAAVVAVAAVLPRSVLSLLLSAVASC